MTIDPLVKRRSPRPALALSALAIAMPLMASLGSGASAAPYNPSNLPPEQLSAVGRTCQTVIGLSPGESHYVGCVESLSDSLRSSDRGRALIQARGDCIDQGLKPETPELATCTLTTSGTKSGVGPAPRRMDQTGDASPAKSYFTMSPRAIHQREEMSCARLGLDPTTGAFARCVAGLQASLFAADNPMN